MHEKRRHKNRIFIAISILLALFLAASLNADVGDKPLDFTLEDLDGKTLKLSDYAGKVVLLNFWATWCPPCRAEIPHFVELVTEHEKEGLVILGLSSDRGGSEVVLKWLEQNPVNYPMAMSDGVTSGTYQSYLPEHERGGIPFSFVIDRKGKIRHQLVGYRDKSAWENMLMPLINEK